MMNIETIRNEGWLLFEAIAGSRAYGLATATSDTDIRGVFILPRDMYYSNNHVAQVSNETNDIVFYELGRFIELLEKNNPNILELLSVPEDCVLYRHPLMDSIRPSDFLSKLCEQSFANYAFTQIRKAYGLEKKIVNPIEQERKSILDFCYVYTGGNVQPLAEFAAQHGYKMEDLGLAALPHIRDGYNLYYRKDGSYSGISSGPEANDVRVSSIPKGETPAGLLYFNKYGYSVYCKRYKEYWDWVEKRNEARYQSTVKHGKQYDAKNMMHVFRLLKMAIEIAEEGSMQVRRKDREWLLQIKAGAFEYDELLGKAEEMRMALAGLYSRAVLPEKPDPLLVNDILVSIRKEYYGDK